jgi:hypothetical protein
MDSPGGGEVTAPVVAMPEPTRHDTIPVQPEWLEVDDGPPAAPIAAPAIPRPPAKPALEGTPNAKPALRRKSSRPPKDANSPKRSSAPPKRRG